MNDFIKQQLADEPQDRAITIIAQNKAKLCYSPTFNHRGESYIYLDSCSSENVIPARYDVFQRLAYKINNQWMCITAPASITGSKGAKPSKTDWDYVTLMPCVLNDPDQRWVIKNNAFYTAVDNFRLKDYQYYGFISKNSKDYYDHTLDSSMNQWINTIATPPALTIKTSIAWNYSTSSSGEMYYLNSINYSAQGSPIELYYNPENQRIFDYDKISNRYYCMYSTQTKGQDWNWTKWRVCDDTVPTKKDYMAWDFRVYGLTTELIDYNKNILRVTKKGNNWGYPYTVTNNYLYKDTANQADSTFYLGTFDIDKWVRYYYGNIGDNLNYCPAPNKKYLLNNNNNNNNKNSGLLPENFVLTEAWIKRLYDIANTTKSGVHSAIGMCGICALHSFQMVAELGAYKDKTPLTKGGYLFDTQPNTDPFISFKKRYPLLSDSMQAVLGEFNSPYNYNETVYQRIARSFYFTALIVIPQFSLNLSAVAEGDKQVLEFLKSLFKLSNGTVAILAFWFLDPTTKQISGHGLPIIKNKEGVIVVPTNDESLTFEQFKFLIKNPVKNANDLLYNISFGGAKKIQMAFSLIVEYDYDNYNLIVSNNNCDGLGDHRKGSGKKPTSKTINKCSGGRCNLL